MRLNKDEYSKLHKHQVFLKEIARIDKDMPLARLITLLDVVLYPNRIGGQIAKSTLQSDSSTNRHINYWRHTYRGTDFPDKTPWLQSEINPEDFRIKRINPTDRGISQIKKLLADEPLELPSGAAGNSIGKVSEMDAESPRLLWSPRSADDENWSEFQREMNR